MSSRRLVEHHAQSLQNLLAQLQQARRRQQPSVTIDDRDVAFLRSALGAVNEYLAKAPAGAAR